MRVALINPRGGSIKQGMPLAFGYLKSNTDGHDIRIIDCTLDGISPNSFDFASRVKDISPEVVGISSWSVNFSEALVALEVAKLICPNVTTVFGGAYATIAANKVIKEEMVDFVIRGEAEFSFPVFLDELSKSNPDFSKVSGLVYRNAEGDRVFNEVVLPENLDDIKLPDYDFINIEGYIEKGYRYQNTRERSAPIWATRGCPYTCAFCAVSLLNGRKFRKHSVEYMVQWVEMLYTKHSIRGFNIVDDNFTFDSEYAKSFCREVIKLGYNDIEFINPNAIRMQRGDCELWDLMKQAGWSIITIAPESGSERVLRNMRKDLDVKEVPSIVRDIREAGLGVHGFFMVGYPGETMEDLSKTASLVMECKFDLLSISLFQPMLGTPVYDELVDRGEIGADFTPTYFQNFENPAYVTPALRGFDFWTFVNKLYHYCNKELKGDLCQKKLT